MTKQEINRESIQNLADVMSLSISTERLDQLIPRLEGLMTDLNEIQALDLGEVQAPGINFDREKGK